MPFTRGRQGDSPFRPLYFALAAVALVAVLLYYVVVALSAPPRRSGGDLRHLPRPGEAAGGRGGVLPALRRLFSRKKKVY